MQEPALVSFVRSCKTLAHLAVPDNCITEATAELLLQDENLSGLYIGRMMFYLDEIEIQDEEDA